MALNSVAGDNVDLISATAPSNPTIVIAAPPTIQTYLYNPATVLPSTISKYMSSRTLENGNLPSKSGGQPALSKLRVLLIPQLAAPAPQIRLPSSSLHSLRTHLHARIGYALTTPFVAGAIAQTNILDYRDKSARVCVGAPLSSVEVHLNGEEDVMGSHDPKGPVCSALCPR